MGNPPKAEEIYSTHFDRELVLVSSDAVQCAITPVILMKEHDMGFIFRLLFPAADRALYELRATNRGLLTQIERLHERIDDVEAAASGNGEALP